MAYATKEEIVSEFKRLDITTVDSVVTEDEIDRFIAEAEALINASIQNEYIVPMTEATSILILKKIVIDFVTFRVNKILKIKSVKATAGNVEQSKNSSFQCYVDSKKLLKEIAKGSILLNGTKNDSSSALSSFSTDNDYEPIFEMQKDQW